MGQVTQLLRQSAAGDREAHAALYALLYSELTRLARSQLAQAGAITLDASALVHESWLRTVNSEGAPPERRAQFFGIAASVMRSVIIDHVRRRGADKRGGGVGPVTLSTSIPDEDALGDSSVQRIDEALRELARMDARCHDVVEMRYFAGLGHAEIALALGISEPTVKRDWRRAKAFLYDYLSR